MRFPSTAPISKECMDVILKLLKKEPTERLGDKGGPKEIMEHPWFAKINFEDLINKKVNNILERFSF